MEAVLWQHKVVGEELPQLEEAGEGEGLPQPEEVEGGEDALIEGTIQQMKSTKCWRS